MPGIDLANRLATVAVVKGLRDGGEIGEKTISAIVKALRAQTAVSDDMGHDQTSTDLHRIADAIESGGSGK